MLLAPAHFQWCWCSLRYVGFRHKQHTLAVVWPGSCMLAPSPLCYRSQTSVLQTRPKDFVAFASSCSQWVLHLRSCDSTSLSHVVFYSVLPYPRWPSSNVWIHSFTHKHFLHRLFTPHIERIGSEEFVKKVYMIESVGRWRNRVKEYMCERGATRGGELDQARRECLDRERWRLFCHGHTLGGHPWREWDIRAIDR